MPQIHPDQRLSFSLSSQKAGQKQKGQILAVSAQLMALVSALRSLSSVALSSARVSPVYHPFLTPLRQGDILTLHKGDISRIIPNLCETNIFILD